MFTGIIQAVGKIKAMESRGGDLRLTVISGELPMADTAIGDSIATNGVCLTVIERLPDSYIADVSRETLNLTTLNHLKPGARVNLEKALTLNTPLGGHLVSGHVDGVGQVIERREDARSVRFRMQAPENLVRYIAHKGSICVDGASLTVNGVQGAVFELNVVPHTMEQTIMAEYRVGSRVNLEVDLVARYLEQLLLADAGKTPENGVTESGVSLELLARQGFLK